MTNARFAVVVRYEKAWDEAANTPSPDVWWHRSADAAARRLAALINRRASWVPARVSQGTRFYIVDHGLPSDQQRPGVRYPRRGAQYALADFRKQFLGA